MKRRQQLSKLMIAVMVIQAMASLPIGVSAAPAPSVIPQEQTKKQTQTAPAKPAANSATTGVNKNTQAYKLVSHVYSKENKANVYLYEHIKSGGQVFYVEADDNHLVMDVIVKTPAEDQTGANHILEHALLSGSEKYPTKSPFQTVSSTSVSTFANAITYTDYTCFPFSTVNTQDFDNLFKVYLDGIFAPKIIKDENLFKREGWRYATGANGKIEYKGVVYSEMKGAGSTPDSVHSQGIMKSLYNGSSYANESGGLPEEIVGLSYKKLVDNYKKYYQPSNMLIYLYGKMDINEKLAYLDQNYLSKYDKKVVELKEGTALPITHFSRLENYYHVNSGTELDQKGIYSINIPLKDLSAKDQIGLNLLMSVMCNVGTSRMNEDFYRAKLSKSFVGTSDTYSKKPSVSFTFYDMTKKSAEKIDAFVMGELAYHAKSGFDKRDLATAFDSMKLNNALKDMSVNKGLNLREWIESGYVAQGDPAYYFNRSELMDQVIYEAINEDYFEKLVSKYLLGSKEITTVLTLPQVGLNEQSERYIQGVLDERIAKMSEKDHAALLKSISDFDAWNSKADSEADLAKLPALTMDKVKLSQETLIPTEEKIEGAKLLTYEVPSNSVGDLTLYFDMDVLTEEEQRDLTFFKNYFFSMPTKTMTADELYSMMLSKTTGVHMGEMALTATTGGAIVDKRFYVNVTALDYNMVYATDLLGEIFKNQKFDSKSFALYSLDSLKTDLEYSLTTDGDDLAYALLTSHISPAGAYYAQNYEPEHARLKEQYNYFSTIYPALLERVQSIYKKLFNQNNLVVTFAGTEQSIETTRPFIIELIKGLKSEVNPSFTSTFEYSRTNEAVIIPSKVQFIQKGFNLGQIGQSVSGKDFVFAKWLNNEYMEKTVREQNGAYGGSFEVTLDGNMIFSSYRDPSIEPTLKAMDGAVDWLKKQNLTQKQIDAIIIGLIGQMEQPENPFSNADRLARNYMSNASSAEKQRIYQEMTETTPADLMAFIAKLESGMKASSTVVVGSEAEIEKVKSLFDSVRKVME